MDASALADQNDIELKRSKSFENLFHNSLVWSGKEKLFMDVVGLKIFENTSLVFAKS